MGFCNVWESNHVPPPLKSRILNFKFASRFAEAPSATAPLQSGTQLPVCRQHTKRLLRICRCECNRDLSTVTASWNDYAATNVLAVTRCADIGASLPSPRDS